MKRPPMYRWCRVVPRWMRPIIDHALTALGWISAAVLVLAVVLGGFTLTYRAHWQVLEGLTVTSSVDDDGDLVLLLNGTKRHGKCPGVWKVHVYGPDQEVISTRWLPTGGVPVGRLSNYPVPTGLPLRPGAETAQAVIRYECPVAGFPGVWPFEYRYTAGVHSNPT